jgi:hypothetical protein
MARIKIEDLPPFETMTPEEQEEILGAGSLSFRPTFEALEDRQLMAAGFGSASLGSIVAQHRMMADALVRQVSREVSHQQTPIIMSQETLQNAVVPSDALNPAAFTRALGGEMDLAAGMATAATSQETLNVVAGKAKDKFGEVIAEGRFGNVWTLQRVESTSQAYAGADNSQIRVTLNFTYGVTNDGNRGSVELYFTGGLNGGQQRWKFSEAKELKWKSPLPDFAESKLRDGLTDRIQTVYKNYSVDAGTVYDQRQVVRDLAQKAEDTLRAKGLYSGDLKLIVSSIEGLERGGLRLTFALSYGNELQVQFGYNGRTGQVHRFGIQDMNQLKYREGQREGSWEKGTLDPNVAVALKSVDYKVNHGDRSRELTDGQRLSDSVLNSIVARASGVKEAGNWLCQGDAKGKVTGVELTDQGFRIVLEVTRQIGSKTDAGYRDTLTAQFRLSFDLDGIDRDVARYKNTYVGGSSSLASGAANPDGWTKAFGISEDGAEIKKDFNNWTSYRSGARLQERIVREINSLLQPTGLGGSTIKNVELREFQGAIGLTCDLEAAGGVNAKIAIRLTGEKYNAENGRLEFTATASVVYSSNPGATAEFAKGLSALYRTFSIEVAQPAPQGSAPFTATPDQQQRSEAVPTNAPANQVQPSTTATDAFFARLGQEEGTKR